MTIKFYQNKSDSIFVSKSLTEVHDYTGTMRRDASIVDPVLQIQAENLAKDLCNYMYIPQFERYYFIYTIDSIRKNLWQVTGHVDVLMSFASDIKASTQFVNRQENKRNQYLRDSSIPVTTKRNFVCKEFGDGFIENNYFILTTMGGVAE